MSVGAEGSRRVGADPGGAECAVSLPAGYFPAAILTCHSSLRLHVSTTDKQTGGSSGATVDHLREVPLKLSPLFPLSSSPAAIMEERRADFRDM